MQILCNVFEGDVIAHAIDAITGDSIGASFIPADPATLSTPIEALLTPNRQSIQVSDQFKDAVLQCDLSGSFMDLFAPVRGVNTAILDNVRGMEFTAAGHLLVSVGGGGNVDTIAEFDGAGNLIESQITGVSARFITLAFQGPPPEPVVVSSGNRWTQLMLVLLLALLYAAPWRRSR